mmetsp:Transcript_54571/g.61777  ORF Transcript_54571/g.61777 Transcript_54571/m.61777 type:complete len:136 (-) Transcript_54571:321-728(-)
MQEPILTRWKTVGEACRFVNNYFDVLLVFAETLSAMKDIKNQTQTGLCAANYASLAREEELEINLAFVSDFYQFFFDSHMEFNHSTDLNIKAEGFLVQHHLVRYYLKVTELKLLEKKLENGSIYTRLPTLLLKSF